MKFGDRSKTAIVVLGMHRSGTSVLTRLISLMGAALPKNVMAKHPSNPTGFWEPQKLMELNDRMLEEAGRRWDDWRSVDLQAMGSDRLRFYRSSIRNLLVEEYDDAQLIVLKEPRICRLAAFYEDILTEIGYQAHFIIPIRNPIAVAFSLAERDGITLSSGKMLWLRHVLDAEFATRTFSRCFVSYEALAADWKAVASAIANTFGVALRHDPGSVPELETFLNPELMHHRYSDRDLEGNGLFDPWLRATYRHLKGLEDDPQNAGHATSLDLLRSEVDAFSSRAGELTFPELQRREDAIRSEKALRLGLEERVASLSHQMDVSKSELIATQQQIETMKNSTSWRITAPIRAIKVALS